MADRELLERALTDHERMKRQIEIQAATEYARIFVLAGTTFAFLLEFKYGRNPLAGLLAYGFIGVMWIDYIRSKARWQALSDWIDREHAETLRLVRSAES